MIEKIESDVHKDAITERNQTHEADLTISCECTLEEFFHGSTKELKFERKRLLGDERTVENEIVRKEIEIKPGTQPGSIHRIASKGMSRLRGATRVDLYIHIGIEIPSKLSKKESELLRELSKLRGDDSHLGNRVRVSDLSEQGSGSFFTRFRDAFRG